MMQIMNHNNDLIVLKINLDDKTQTNEALRKFEQHHKTIVFFFFESRRQRRFYDYFIWPTDDVRQLNFVNFLQAMVEKFSENSFLQKHPKYISIRNQYIGINEAKLLAQIIIINEQAYSRLELKFDCQLSQMALQHMLLEHARKGKDANKKNYYIMRKNEKSQILAFCGGGINCSHAKALSQILMASSSSSSSLLQSLSLKSTNICDNGAIALANALCQNTSLKSLNLYCNNIGGLGAEALGNMLCQNSSLETLDLCFNQLGNRGVVALAKALQVNSSLQQLDLAVVGCHNECLFALANGLDQNKSLKSLDLNENKFVKYELEGIKAFGQSMRSNSTLSKLCLAKTFPEDDGGLSIGSFVNSISGKTSHLEIDLSSNMENEFERDATSCLIECNAPHLAINLSSSQLRPSHIESLAFGIQQQTFNIQSLNLDRAQMDENSIKELFHALAETSCCSLIHLSLQFVSGIYSQGGGTQHIVNNLKMTNLQSLYLTAIPIGNDGVEQIANYINDTKLTKIGLSMVRMKDSGLIALANALKLNNTKLTYLDISSNSAITCVGIQSLLETLRDYNMTLKMGPVNKCGNAALDKQIEFYVALNKAHRSKLYCEADLIPICLFPWIIEGVCNNASIVFWILQTNPHLLRPE